MPHGLKWIALLAFLLFCSHAYSAFRCSEVYSTIIVVESSHIRFSQNYLGHEWAKLKSQVLDQSFDKWASQNGNKSKKDYILETTQNSPLPAIRDVDAGKLTSFPRSVKLKKGEVVFFSFITYKSRAARDRINKKVMNDPRLKKMMNSKSMPFDGKRMIWGGFKPVVKKES